MLLSSNNSHDFQQGHIEQARVQVENSMSSSFSDYTQKLKDKANEYISTCDASTRDSLTASRKNFIAEFRSTMLTIHLNSILKIK